eukprot:SAG31_NODE_20848_length_564_cov_0.913978_1_plen_58_part_01
MLIVGFVLCRGTVVRAERRKSPAGHRPGTVVYSEYSAQHDRLPVLNFLHAAGCDSAGR